MKILLLYKKSSFESYLRTFKSPELRRFEQTHKTHYLTLAKIESILKAKQLNYQRHCRGKKINYKPFNLVVTVGGDGTFLEASHHITNQLIIGVNSDPSWSVGRFCTATAETFEAMLEAIIKGKHKVQLLHRMNVQLSNQKQSCTVLNDILICHQNPAAMSRYNIMLGTIKEEHRSSGVWVATAAGSTGAIRSAGGKVLNPQSPLLQFRVRELYKDSRPKYHLQGALLQKNSRFALTSLMREGVVFVDGSHICLPFPFGTKVTVKSSAHPLKMVVK